MSMTICYTSVMWYTANLKALCKTIAKCKTEAEAKKFLRDLCTMRELREMARRFEAARLIQKGMAYRSIAKKTGLSTATITRVAHWLRNGEGGYRLLLKK